MSMLMRRGRAVVVVFGLTLYAGGCGLHASQRPPSIRDDTYDPLLGLASFDSAWARLGATYYDTTFRGNNWLEMRRLFRPMAERARSNAQVREAIDSLFARLGDSHLTIIPNDVADEMKSVATVDSIREVGSVGIESRLVDGRLTVVTVEPRSTAAGAGVQLGWEILEVDGLRVAHLMEAARSLTRAQDRRRALLQIPLRVRAATERPVGTRIALSFRAPDTRSIRMEIPAGTWRGDIVKYGPLPPQFFSFSHRRLEDADGCVGAIYFSAWMLPVLPRMEQAMSELSVCRGIVLDLRGNLGGVAALVMGTSGFFVNDTVSLGRLDARGTSLRYMVNPRRSNRLGQRVEPFAGPVAIVVDELSASTSEIFAQGMREIGRARLFGDTTAGEALPAGMSRLPNGDLMIHAIADFHSPNGKRIEATGVVPDEVFPRTRKALLANRDQAFERAVDWVKSHSVTVPSRVTRRSSHP